MHASDARRRARCASPSPVAATVASAQSLPRSRRRPTIQQSRQRRVRRSSRPCRKARTPTTSRRWRRSTPNLFGIALVTPDGHVYTAGDVETEVSIQSISKVFTMARVIQDSGEKAIEDNIGVDATGSRSTRSSRSSSKKGHEMNPLVNPGAITTTSMVAGRARRTTSGTKIIEHLRRLRRAPAVACCRTSTSPSRTRTSATRRSAR